MARYWINVTSSGLIDFYGFTDAEVEDAMLNFESVEESLTEYPTDNPIEIEVSYAQIVLLRALIMELEKEINNRANTSIDKNPGNLAG